MAEPTLSQVFGSNATQDSTTFTISKADLASVSLTASANNTAESLVVAILLKAAAYLKDSSQQLDPDIQVTIADSGFPQIITRNNIQYRQVTFNVNLQTVDTGFVLDPDDY
ncbi:MAG: hypothetical protein KME23_07985 [Goleter apudmare HA4340-LM2]|jgi:hypothetical protein|nr:hypothetical protein [Goleter apudmare HA4340-LM2]